MARFARQQVIAAGVPLTVIDCWSCGVVFALTSTYDAGKRESHDAFYCPNGHRCAYSDVETAQDREARELRERTARAERDAAEQRRLREWAESRAKGANIAAGLAKAAKRRLEQRITCGVCPHCQRTFKQLAAHMKSKHRSLVLGGTG